MQPVQKCFAWDAPSESDANAKTSAATAEPLPVVSEITLPAPPSAESADVGAAVPRLDDLPSAMPLRAAVDAGIFGLTDDGPVDPDREEVEAITQEHAHEMIILQCDLHAATDAVRTGCDPCTGRTPRTPESQAKLARTMESEAKRLTAAYSDAVAAYAEAFGDEAAARLDAWVRRVSADQITGTAAGYPPTHPWHYYHAGDDAVPTPVDQIPADLDAGGFLDDDLPKNRTKRVAALRERFERERRNLEADRQRYAAIAEQGAEALSRYDREIAHTSDAMARASALALKYRHVSLGLGRLQWIEEELRRLGDSTLFADSETTGASI